jgi:predicted metalloprotease with PDZ domain
VSLEGRLGGGNEAVPLLATVSTDGAGRYELSGVAPGLTSVMVEAQDHHARLLAGMSVREGADLEVNVTLSPVQEGEEPTIELAGIGAVLSTSDDVLVIVRVVEGGGAAEVGLASGDAVTSVDGTPVVDLGFGGSINRIRGPEGSTVRLGVRRRGRETVEVVDVPRRRVRAR